MDSRIAQDPWRLMCAGSAALQSDPAARNTKNDLWIVCFIVLSFLFAAGSAGMPTGCGSHSFSTPLRFESPAEPGVARPASSEPTMRTSPCRMTRYCLGDSKAGVAGMPSDFRLMVRDSIGAGPLALASVVPLTVQLPICFHDWITPVLSTACM